MRALQAKALKALLAVLVVATGWVVVVLVVPPARSAPVKPPDLVLSGNVDGLWPGRSQQLRIAIANQGKKDVQFTDVSVTVTSTNRTGCPTTAMLATSYHASAPVTVRKGGSAWVEVPVKLTGGAPNACQGATFRLHYEAAFSK